MVTDSFEKRRFQKKIDFPLVFCRKYDKMQENAANRDKLVGKVKESI